MKPWDLDFWIPRGRILSISCNLPEIIGFLDNIRFSVYTEKKGKTGIRSF